MIRKLVLPALAIYLLALPLAAQTDVWKKYNNKEGNFTALFPGTPDDTVNSSDENVKSHTLMARYESAMLASAEGKYEVAAKQLENLTQENPDWLDPHVELAALYYKLGRKQDGARERSTIDRLMKEQQSRLSNESQSPATR